MALICRPAQPHDAASILTLAQTFASSFVIEPAAFQQTFSALLADTHIHLAVAEQKQHLIGYLLGFVHPTFYANGPVAWVEEITISAADRRQGVGRLLMLDFERWAAKRGANLVALATRRAAPFYQALGYQESATYFRKLRA
ncbi:MAG: GNAT family N-acetyltransferase [Roseiflexaceae bacterium]